MYFIQHVHAFRHRGKKTDTQYPDITEPRASDVLSNSSEKPGAFLSLYKLLSILPSSYVHILMSHHVPLSEASWKDFSL